MECFCKNSELLLAANFFSETLHLRCLRESWIQIWTYVQKNLPLGNLYYRRHHWRHQSEENITSLLFIDFEKAIDSIHRGNIKENLLVCGILEATTKTIEKLYTNVKAQVIIIDGDKEPFDITFFDITAGITQFDTLASFTYLIWLCTWSK